jgi:hypothetical protein
MPTPPADSSALTSAWKARRFSPTIAGGHQGVAAFKPCDIALIGLEPFGELLLSEADVRAGADNENLGG